MLDFSGIENTSEWLDSRAERKRRQYRREPSKRPASGRAGVKATLLDLPICAIDGEGKTRPSGRHDYTLLCAAWPDGTAKLEAQSLSTEQCFEFLMRLPEHHTYVIYGGSYDFNMMMRDLPIKTQNLLLDKGRAYYKKYAIRWIDRKFFRLRANGRSITIYDVLANWQVKFVDACKAWKVGTESELDIVLRMKEQRGNFDDVDDTAITDYCFLECDLLRELCRRLFDAILATPYRPNAVYGPGALASAAMNREGVKRYMAPLPDHLEPLTHYAYFGGRFDCAMIGWFTDVWQYDIKSAYPDQIRFLPCLTCAEWRKLSYAEYVENGLPEWGLLQVEWDVGENAPWPPFPHRDSKGNIFYPSRGKGWYHASEVAAAMAMYGDQITFITGWALDRKCNHVPFNFVDAIFQLRKELPYAQGVVFKLILNSLYGKLAQQVGSDNERKPPFQCFYWAGAITAGTRAKILRALSSDPNNVIGIATDSIVALRECNVPIGGELGEWEVKSLAEYAQVSNGIYKGSTQHGEQVERSRGFARSTLDWDAVRRDFIATNGVGKHCYEGKSRFITLRESRNRLDRTEIACTWTRGVDRKRELSFFPMRRFPGEYSRDGPRREWLSLEPIDLFESQPFKIKTKSQDVIDARQHFNAYDWQDY